MFKRYFLSINIFNFLKALVCEDGNVIGTYFKHLNRGVSKINMQTLQTQHIDTYRVVHALLHTHSYAHTLHVKEVLAKKS